MYLPAHFAETRVEELHRVITEYPLGAFVIHGPNGLDANHLPFELDASAGGQGRLLAHVARANPVWQDVKDGDEVLVIFRRRKPTSRRTGIRASTRPTGRCRPGTIRRCMYMERSQCVMTNVSCAVSSRV